MAQNVTQLQLREVDENGNVKRLLMPINTKKEVIVGNVEASDSLQLPGSNPEEKLEQTIANIKTYLANLSTVAMVKREVVDNADDNSDNLPSTRATGALKAGLDELNAIVAKNKTDIATKAPIMHADADKTYGGGTGELYGHVKVTDTYAYDGTENVAPTAADSVAASPKALNDAYTALNNAKAPVDHASDNTNYGGANVIKYGHVKVSDTYKVAVENGDADHSVVASQKALADAYTDLSSNSETGLASKAPIMHASEDRNYGVGTTSTFGHLKISDDYNMENVENEGNAAAGLAASLYALNRSSTALQALIDTKLAATHADETASASKFSHVKLCDSYTESGGAAADGVAASSKSVADAYAKLNEGLVAAQKSIVTLNSDMTPQSSHTIFNEDGSIVVTTDTSEKTTVFNEDASILSTMKINDEGGLISQTITQKTSFNEDGSIDDIVTAVNDD